MERVPIWMVARFSAVTTGSRRERHCSLITVNDKFVHGRAIGYLRSIGSKTGMAGVNEIWTVLAY